MTLPDEQENVDPSTEQPVADSPSSSSTPVKGKKRSSRSTSSASSSPTDEPLTDNNKKHKTSSTAPRTLTKEELADYIARDEFWQKTKPAEGEGDGDNYGGGDEKNSDDPVYDDCDEIRQKITAFIKTGRMTQTAWCKLLGVNGLLVPALQEADCHTTDTLSIACHGATAITHRLTGQLFMC